MGLVEFEGQPGKKGCQAKVTQTAKGEARLGMSASLPRPVSLPHQGGDTVQGESSALHRKPDPKCPWGIKPETGLVPCQVVNSNPVLGNPTVPRVGFLIQFSKLPRLSSDRQLLLCLPGLLCEQEQAGVRDHSGYSL